MLKHKKPNIQIPSKILSKFFNNFLNINNKPILDIGCGYGRNGAFFINNGYNCIFCDIDIDCLNFIEKGKTVSLNGDIDRSKYEIKKIDFNNELWPFKENSASGIINVHFYNPNLIDKFVSTICRNGFLYIETIDDRGENYLELPEYKYIINTINDKFDILFYKEKRVKKILTNKSTLTILAIKK